MTKIAQVGCGFWGKNLTRNFSEIGALAAVVDANPETRDNMSKTYGVPAISLDEVLADPSIDGVSFATPAETHAKLATLAFDAGKHVYVEKPLALTIADCDAMIAKSEESDRILMVGHLLQYHSIFIAMNQHVKSGLIGDLQYIYSNRMSLGKFRIEENVMWSFAPHDVSMVLGIVGEEPSQVAAQGASIITPGIADWCTMQLVFPGGARGHIQTSWLHPFKEQRLVVIGSEGMLVFEDSQPEWEKKLTLYPHKIDVSGPVPVPHKADLEYLAVEKGEPLKSECQHFIDCITSGKKPSTDGIEGRAVINVLNQSEQHLKLSLETK